MQRRRILLVRDRDFYFYLYQLANLLSSSGHEVHVLHTHNGFIEPLYRDLIDQVKSLGITTHLVEDRSCWLRRKLRSARYRVGFDAKKCVITPSKITQAKECIRNYYFDWIIAFDPASLFLACSVLPKHRTRIVEFSLEVIDEGSPLFQKSRATRQFVAFERRVLPTLAGLMIQDGFRANALLRYVKGFPKAGRTIFYPVAVCGPAIESPKIDFFRKVLPDRTKVRVLFFGALWVEDLFERLISASEKLSYGQVLIIHGGRGCVDLAEKVSPKLVVSRRPVKFDDLDDLIASADIGLALYPPVDLNHELTAFSSEKIARYTKCGLPIIAFRSASYEHLMSQTQCGELIEGINELPEAIDKIVADYSSYRARAFRAYERFYRLENTSKDLLSFCER